MAFVIKEKNLDRLIMIGDRILIKPKTPQSRTDSGLYLPPGVTEKERVNIGYVVKVGPGYPIPSVSDTEEPWKEASDEVKYVPLQPQVGDQAVYLQTNAIEIEFNTDKYIIISHSSLLMLMRDEGLLE